MPRRHGPALLTALVAGTAALAAIVALAGSLLFSGGGAKQVGTESVARTPAAAKPLHRCLDRHLGRGSDGRCGGHVHR